MIKKWSYVVATVATVLGGTFLTGCIDNDEPFGITQIRVETANLLKAKQAAVEAQAAADVAAAEVAKLEIELKKTELEIARLKAESEAKINEMLAAAEAAKTEAEAEVLKAQAEAIIEEAKAKADALRLKAQAMADLVQTKIDKANFQLQKLQEQWEAEKIKNAAADNDKLYGYLKTAYNAYIAQLRIVNNATYAVSAAQSEYAKVMSDLVWDKDTNTFSYPYTAGEAKLKGQINGYQNTVDQLTKTIERYNAAKEAAENSDLNTLLAQYKEDYAKNLENLGKAQAEIDAVYVDNKTVLDNARDLVAQVNGFGSKPIEIPAYTYEPSDALKAIGVTEQEIVAPKTVYTLNSAGVSTTVIEMPDHSGHLGNVDNTGTYPGETYQSAVRAYKSEIVALNSYFMDVNDKEWTQARIEEMKRELQSGNALYNSRNALWEAAVAAYNKGGVPDASALEPYGQEAIEDAVAEFNKLADVLTPLADAVKTAKTTQTETEEAVKEAVAAYNEGKDENQQLNPENNNTAIQQAYNDWLHAQEDYSTGLEAAAADFEKAKTDALTVLNNVKEAGKDAVKVATTALNHAEAEKILAETQKNSYKGSDAEILAKLAKNLKDKTDAYDKAQEDKEKAEENADEDNDAAQEKYDDAIRDATMKNLETVNSVEAAYEKASITWKNALLGDAAFADIQKAMEANVEANAALTKAQTAWQEVVGVEDYVDNVVKPIEDAYNVQSNLLYQASVNDESSNGRYSWSHSNYVINIKTNFRTYITKVTSEEEDIEFPVVEDTPVTMYRDDDDGTYLNAKELAGWIARSTYGGLKYSVSVTSDNNNNWYVTVDEDNLNWLFGGEFFITKPTLPEVTRYIKVLLERCEVNYSEDFGSVNELKYIDYYWIFGTYGNNLLLQNRIAVAEAYLQNANLIQPDIEKLQANLKALEDSKTAAVEEYNTLYDNAEAAVQKWDDLVADAKAKYDNLNHISTDLTTIINNLESALASVMANADGSVDMSSPAAVKIFAENIDKNIKNAEAQLAGAQDALARTQKALADFQNGDYYAAVVETEKNNVEYFTGVLSIEQEYLDFLKSRVDELQKAYDKATGNNSGDNTGAEE